MSDSSDSTASPDGEPAAAVDDEYGDDYFAKYLADGQRAAALAAKADNPPPRFVTDDPQMAQSAVPPSLRHRYQLDKDTNQWVLRNLVCPNEQPCQSRRYVKAGDGDKYTGRARGVRDGPAVAYQWNAEEKRWVTSVSDQYSVITKYKAPDGTRYAWVAEKQAWLPDDSAASDPEDAADKRSTSEGNETVAAASRMPTIKYVDTVSSEYRAPNGTLYVLDKETNKWHATCDAATEERTDAGEPPAFADANMPDIKTADGTVYEWDRNSDEWNEKSNEATDEATDDAQAATASGLYTAPDGTVYEWDTVRNGWFPKIDDDFIAQYQASYGFVDHQASVPSAAATTTSASKPSTSAAAYASAEPSNDPADASGDPAEKRKKTPATWFDEDPNKTTKVYVQNLPDDITEDEFAELMSKYGMILRDPKTKKPRIKLYAEPGGQLKGDALCTYVRVESVDMVLNLLDGTDYRGRPIKVQRAKFEMRGSYNAALKPKRSKKDKQKQRKQQEKMLDWRPDRMRGERDKHENAVIFKNLFEADVFVKQVGLLLDYQEHLREECGKFGRVKKVIVFSTEPEGVAKVVMDTPAEADTVIEMFNGRLYKGRVVSAETWDGHTKYKIQENEAETSDRLVQWEQFLEGDEVQDK